ncbi:UDP-3-O-(3-hydroxymyristoyl)glucosamine N-acyltransferase [Marinospirillum sp.]|uniref:UDP-3-O-(3-hydroxymyristoyl)glucosamine N-acyltransferase n=1 Tax=Marinospirillum sp. TaxID=2183934 RepID=UPI003A86D264
MSITLAQIAQQLDAELRGQADQQITGLAGLAEAQADQLSFLSNPKYAPLLKTTQAGAVLVHPKQADQVQGNALIVPNPYLAFARLTHLFDDPAPAQAERHPSAVIHPDAQLHPSVSVGPHAIIEAGCVIEAGCMIGAQSFIDRDCVIGAGTKIYPRVTLYRRSQLGKNCILHSGAVIGADGFGFAPDGQGGWEKIAQLGRAILGDEVEVGANSTIDRGALGDTVIGDQVKIDNHVMIAHNVQVGKGTAMAAFVGISGSTKIGAHCLLGGSSGYAGHISICDHVQITGMGMVTGSITEPGTYSSGTGLLPSQHWRKSAVRFRQLDDLHHKVRELEKKCQSGPSASE